MVEIGIEVVEKIADREGVDPIDLEVPLGDVIDTDALDSLTNRDSHGRPLPSLRVEFTYMGYEVRVVGGRNVRIDDNPEQTTVDEE